MAYKAVLFDLDGTLLNTLEDLSNAMNDVLRARDFPTHPIERYRFMIGEGAALLARRALPPFARNENTVAEVLQAYLNRYATTWNVFSRPYDGVLDMLSTLVEKRIPLAVLSNKPDVFTKQCVRELLPGIYFDVVWGERDGFKRKPDPEGALQIAGILNIPPSDFLYLGDTATDMKTAIGAGMLPIGVRWGFRTADELQKHGARFLLSHPMELLNFVD